MLIQACLVYTGIIPFSISVFIGVPLAVLHNSLYQIYSVPSIQSKLFNRLLGLVNRREFLRRQFASGQFSFFNSPEPSAVARRNCHIRKSTLNNRNVFELSSKNRKASGTHVLYLHGGAYASSFLTFHWKFLSELVNKTGCIVTAPDFPFAPHHTYKDSFDMVDKLYRQLASEVDRAGMVFMGDSSGGGFALALAQKLQHEHLPQPSRIILISPWLDITLGNPEIEHVNGIEPFLGIKGLREMGRLYAGDTDPAHYLLSPINGCLDNLGKISVFTGTKDILVSDARKLKHLAGIKNVEINYYEYEGMAHAWVFLNLPESKKARHQIMELVLN